ncbi:MAG: 16S rRNA (uracil(1498)-N(3))-methyltransferase [Catonella sp.]|uniref:16S rRNA (uracil(1498)-N(3))-methyltransferase n=1 Tax=Catonella sp. TaxID=2382125 RepID=UPI003F9ECF42
MSIFFIDSCSIDGENAYITGDDVNHIKNVLRMKEKDEVRLSSGNGLIYTAEIKAFLSDRIICKITDCEGEKSELPAKILLFQGLPKKDKMELIIQKAVELGVSKIVPVLMKRTIVKLEDRKKEQKKLERWRTISLTAAKQSGRAIIPEISDFVNFNEAVKMAESLEYNLIPYENEKGMDRARELIKEVNGKKSIGIFIGPEGGIADEELELAIKTGVKPISLGNRILRTETAGLALVSVIAFEIDE